MGAPVGIEDERLAPRDRVLEVGVELDDGLREARRGGRGVAAQRHPVVIKCGSAALAYGSEEALAFEATAGEPKPKQAAVPSPTRPPLRRPDRARPPLFARNEEGCALAPLAAGAAQQLAGAAAGAGSTTRRDTPPHRTQMAWHRGRRERAASPPERLASPPTRGLTSFRHGKELYGQRASARENGYEGRELHGKRARARKKTGACGRARTGSCTPDISISYSITRRVCAETRLFLLVMTAANAPTRTQRWGGGSAGAAAGRRTSTRAPPLDGRRVRRRHRRALWGRLARRGATACCDADAAVRSRFLPSRSSLAAFRWLWVAFKTAARTSNTRGDIRDELGSEVGSNEARRLGRWLGTMRLLGRSGEALRARELQQQHIWEERARRRNGARSGCSRDAELRAVQRRRKAPAPRPPGSSRTWPLKKEAGTAGVVDDATADHASLRRTAA